MKKNPSLNLAIGYQRFTFMKNLYTCYHVKACLQFLQKKFSLIQESSAKAEAQRAMISVQSHGALYSVINLPWRPPIEQLFKLNYI